MLGLPLLKKELLALLRTRRAFWLLFIIVGLSALLPLLAWPSRREVLFYSEQNVVILVIFFITQLAAALLAIPAFTAGAISGERERDTYDLLYATQLSPFSIALSKAIAPTAYVLILLLASAPAACVLYLLGGVSFGMLLKAYAITFASVTMSGLVCLAQSMRSRRTAHAAVRGILLVLLWNGGLMLLLMLGMGLILTASNNWSSGRDFEQVLFFLYGLSPFSALGLELTGEMFPGGAPWAPWLRPWIVSVAFSFLIGTIQVTFLLRKARTPEVSLSRRRERRLLAQRSPRRKVKRPFLARTILAHDRRGLLLFPNPVFIKEVLSEFFFKAWFRRAVFWSTLVIGAAIALLISMNRGHLEDIFLGVSILAASFLILIVPALAATGMPREIDHGNLDFLRGTLLSMREIVSGKFFAALYGSSGILAAAAWICLGAAFLHGLDCERFLGVLAPLIVLPILHIFIAALGNLASAACRRTLPALLGSYLAIAALYLGMPILIALTHRGGDSEVILCALNPFAVLVFCNQGPFHQTSGFAGLALFTILHGGGTVLLWFLAAALAENRARDV
jgi:ABC-type transport system involved in multi-copper enzyme maturation permease subunit